jgi:hypothetical protein
LGFGLQVTLHSARHTPAILQRLSTYGYDEARLDEGVALLDNALSLHAAQKQAYGGQFGATDALTKTRRAADTVYTAHRQLASIAFKDDARRRHALGLNQRKLQTLNGWLGQGVLFYQNLVSEAGALNALARFNVTQADLEQAQASVQQVVELNSVQEREKSAAQQATQARDAALGTLRGWIAELGAVARIALAHSPQQLEALQLGAVASG